MWKRTERILSIILLALLVAAAAFPAIAAQTGKEEANGKGMRIAILDDPILHTDGNASYDANSLRALFLSDGFEADLLNAEDFATADVMNRSAYDLVFLPSGSAFPAKCAANLKSFFADGGKIITSGGYAFSEPLYAQEAGEEVYGKAAYVHSESTASSPCLYRRLNANQFRDGGSYTLRMQVKSENISTESGLAHASVYVYGANAKLLNWQDFVAYTSGSTDWTVKTYMFAVPPAAEYVDIRLGLYISSGTMGYDEIEIVNADGKTVFSEDFEKGIGDWSQMQNGNGIRYETGVGVLQASDFYSYILNESSSGEAGVAYDVTGVLSKNAEAEIRYEEKCGGIAPLPDGMNGSYLRLYKGGKEVSVLPVAAAEGTSGWRGRRKTVQIGNTDFDRADLVFLLKGSTGILGVDTVSVKCGNKTWDESSGEAVYTGSAYKRGRDKESMLLGSNEPISAGDQLFYAPEEIPIFDVETVFSGGKTIKGAEGQAVYPVGQTVFEGDGLSGFSAVTITGNNRGRWQPLLEVFDASGKKVGTAAALFTVFVMPSDYGALGSVQTWYNYPGTSIGFFGVTSHDLFAEGNGALREGLLALARHMCGEVSLCAVANSSDCYREGESPRITVGVENLTKENRDVTVLTEVRSEDTGEVVFTSSSDGSVSAGKRKYFRATWANADLKDDFYEISVCVEQGGRVVDRFETGFVVWKDDVVSKGPKYTYHDNYIHLVGEDGTEKAVYANGVDEGGPFIMEDQNPLVWRRDFRDRADAGILIYETLQQYRGFPDYSAVFATESSFEAHMRKVDAAVYLSQRYGQIYMMGMLLGQNSAVGDKQLEEDRKFVRTMAARYKDVPGIIFYLNGDLVMKMSSDTDPLFRDYLKERYGSDEKLREAWGNSSLSLESASFDVSYAFNGSGWTDTKAYDQNVFRTKLVNRWASELTKAVKEAGGQDRIVLCEFYAWPSEGVDVPGGIGELTYSNTGFFDRLPVFAQTIAYADQRWQGKSFGIGETNKRTHPAFTDTLDYYQSDSYTHARAYFFTTYYTTLAMGGNHHQTWCWKDETKYVFPWGLNTVYESVPKDSFYWLRNSNLVTDTIEPVYKTPEAAIITPDSTRMAGSRGWYLGHYNSVSAIHIAQGTLCENILTLNECNFDIPDGIKVIFYPSAYTVPDNVYEKLLSFVKNGGVLYLSGDPSYDFVSRKRTSENRLKELAGVSAERVIYAGNDQAGAAVTYSDGTHTKTGYPNISLKLEGAEIVYKAADGSPVITRFKVGQGTVFFSADPFENRTDADSFRTDVDIYKLALNAAGVVTAPLKATTASIKSFKLDLKDGGIFRQVINTSAADVRLEYTPSSGRAFEFRLGAYMSAFFREDKDGKLVASMIGGSLSEDGVRVLSNGALAQTVSLDGKDLFESSSMLILPQTAGTLKWQTKADGSGLSVISCQVFGNRIVPAFEVPYRYDAATGMMTVEVDDKLKNTILILSGADEAGLDELKLRVGKMLNGVIGLPSGEKEGEQTQPSDPSIPIAIGAGAAIILLTGLVTFFVMKKKNASQPAEKDAGPEQEDGKGRDE